MVNSNSEVITTLDILFSGFKEDLSRKMDAFNLRMEMIVRELNPPFLTCLTPNTQRSTTTLEIRYSEFKDEVSRKIDAFKLHMEMIVTELSPNLEKASGGSGGKLSQEAMVIIRPGGGVGHTVSQSKQMKLTDSCVLPSSEKWLYLFYEHYEWASVLSYSLYKIDVDLTKTTLDLSPILELERKQYPVQGMRCARLGSKLYFLGGTVMEKMNHYESPRDVYVFDMLTSSFEKMKARLNAEKPEPCVVFAVNGKLYALASIPSEAQVQLSGMKLFECFDPNTGKWQVLDNLPSLNMVKEWSGSLLVPRSIQWRTCTVLGKCQQVVLVGLEKHPWNSEYTWVKCVYDYQQDKWTRHNLVNGPQIISFHEGHDNYLYGLPSDIGPPVKSKLDCPSVLDEIALFSDDETVDGLAYMTIPDKPTLEGENWAKWVYTFFDQPYLNRTCRLLRYLGNDHFCYIAAGMLRSPNSPDCYGYELSDLTTRGINITLFKEKKNQGGEKQLCFKAEILRFQDYHIKITEGLNTAELLECFVVSPENLRKKLAKRKKKKVQSFGSTSG